MEGVIALELIYGTFLQKECLNIESEGGLLTLKVRKFRTVAIGLSIGLVSLILFHIPTTAQSPGNKQEEPSWKIKLYEKDVKYEDSVCSQEDSGVVATFFKEHPLKSFLPICHNDCPVIKCRPVVLFPSIAKSARVSGTISVHVVVDEKGKVLYARVLGGHPLLRAAVRKGACETQFREHSYGKHQGVMHFTVDDYEFLGVPNSARYVW